VDDRVMSTLDTTTEAFANTRPGIWNGRSSEGRIEPIIYGWHGWESSAVEGPVPGKRNG